MAIKLLTQWEEIASKRAMRARWLRVGFNASSSHPPQTGRRFFEHLTNFRLMEKKRLRKSFLPNGRTVLW